MRPSRILFIFLLLFYGCSTEQGSTAETPVVKKPRQLAKLVFEALKSGDFTGVAPYFINTGDVEYFLEQKLKTFRKNKARYRKQIAETEKSRANVAGKFAALRKKRLELTRRTFGELRKKLVKQGLSWPQARFIGMHLENTRYKYGIPYADLLITIGAADTNFVIRLPACARFGRGWIFSETPRWDGKARTKTR